MIELEIMGWIGSILQIIGGIYLAITQKTSLFLWLVWTIGAPLVIIPLLVYGDLKNAIVFMVFEGNNLLGLYRWFRKRNTPLHISVRPPPMSEKEFEDAIIAKHTCINCGNATFEYLSVIDITKCDVCGCVIDLIRLKKLPQWKRARKNWRVRNDRH